ncbi:MAG: magnesium transporter [Desulfobacteraceae bacterium]|nr:magnesium transporter [Desulfobacteraceae bacterium]
MKKPPPKILHDMIRRLLRRNAVGSLRRIVGKTHPADLARVVGSLDHPQKTQLFALIGNKGIQAQLLSKLDPDDLLIFVNTLDQQRLIRLLEQLPTDDAADLIGRLPAEKAEALLKGMRIPESEAVGELLQYDHQVAGGIMVPDFLAFSEDTTAGQAIESLQTEQLDVEMPFYLYVVDQHKRLSGVCSLRQLVSVPPQTPLKAFMCPDVYSVAVDTDQEEVARMVARYDLLAVPVVDGLGHLVGIVTVDDVIDIIREEATEDILKMAGVGQSFVETKSILTSTRIRLPWLFASCLGGILAFFIIEYFESTLAQVVYLAAFIPVIMGMGGNVGTQSSTIVVRGLATERINVRQLGSVVLKEVSVGGILGLFYGVLLGVVAFSSYRAWRLGLVVSGAVLLSMATAAMVGSLVPMLCARFRVDPAVATGPFVTTSMDVISVFSYFLFAKYLLDI